MVEVVVQPQGNRHYDLKSIGSAAPKVDDDEQIVDYQDAFDVVEVEVR